MQCTLGCTFLLMPFTWPQSVWLQTARTTGLLTCSDYLAATDSMVCHTTAGFFEPRLTNFCGQRQHGLPPTVVGFFQPQSDLVVATDSMVFQTMVGSPSTWSDSAHLTDQTYLSKFSKCLLDFLPLHKHGREKKAISTCSVSNSLPAYASSASCTTL